MTKLWIVTVFSFNGMKYCLGASSFYRSPILCWRSWSLEEMLTHSRTLNVTNFVLTISSLSNAVITTALCFEGFKRTGVTKSPRKNIKASNILYSEKGLSKWGIIIPADLKPCLCFTLWSCTDKSSSIVEAKETWNSWHWRLSFKSSQLCDDCHLTSGNLKILLK